MLKVKLRVRRYQRRIYDPRIIIAAVERRQALYASMVEGMYLETVEDWSDEHGPHDATPIVRGDIHRPVINIYLRGDMAFVFAMQDMGYLRKISIIGGVGGSPKLGSKGNLATGRMLRQPIPVKAKHYTEKIARACRSGNTEFGTYAEFLRKGLVDMKKLGPWGYIG